MKLLSASEAAKKLGISPSRIRALIAAGRLPAQKVSRDFVIQEKDLALVAKRPPGRPVKAKKR